MVYVCTVKYEEAKSKFIEAWGTLGSQWGINRTMSQIHALLMLSPGALSTEDIMNELQISRGNANMNIRSLMDWGLISKELKPGDRKEYFKSGKDIWEIARKIVAERKKREIQPVVDMLEGIRAESQGDSDDEKVKALNDSISSIHQFSVKANDLADKFVRSDENWFYKSLMKLMS